MVRYVVVLRGAYPYQGPFLGGGGLKIETFLGPEMATSVASAIWAQKRREITNKNMSTKIH